MAYVWRLIAIAVAVFYSMENSQVRAEETCKAYYKSADWSTELDLKPNLSRGTLLEIPGSGPVEEGMGLRCMLELQTPNAEKGLPLLEFVDDEFYENLLSDLEQFSKDSEEGEIADTRQTPETAVTHRPEDESQLESLSSENQRGIPVVPALDLNSNNARMRVKKTKKTTRKSRVRSISLGGPEQPVPDRLVERPEERMSKTPRSARIRKSIRFGKNPLKELPNFADHTSRLSKLLSPRRNPSKESESVAEKAEMITERPKSKHLETYPQRKVRSDGLTKKEVAEEGICENCKVDLRCWSDGDEFVIIHASSPVMTDDVFSATIRVYSGPASKGDGNFKPHVTSDFGGELKAYIDLVVDCKGAKQFQSVERVRSSPSLS